MKKLKIFLIILIVIIFGTVLWFSIELNKNTSSVNIATGNSEDNVTDEIKIAKLQVLRNDITDNSTDIVQEITVKKGDIVPLSQNDEYKTYGNKANDITILDINDKYVEISRIKHVVLYNEEGKLEESTKENISEKIQYNTSFEITIDEKINSLLMGQARYSYSLKFSK